MVVEAGFRMYPLSTCIILTVSFTCSPADSVLCPLRQGPALYTEKLLQKCVICDEKQREGKKRRSSVYWPLRWRREERIRKMSREDVNSSSLFLKVHHAAYLWTWQRRLRVLVRPGVLPAGYAQALNLWGRRQVRSTFRTALVLLSAYSGNCW